MLFATILTLTAATLHATWNLLLKSAPTQDRDLTAWGLFIAGALLVFPVLVLVGGPGVAAVPWLALSAVVHVAYLLGLVAAYRHGDFSLAYPLARGGGAVAAALGGALLLGDDLSWWAWGAIGVVVVGLLSLVGRGTSTAALRSALLTAAAIGSYTLIDAKGARVATSGLAYGLAVSVASALGISLALVLRGRGPALRVAAPAAWRTWAVAGACTAMAYALVLIAVRHAPVGYVAMLRESSVVLGAVAGWRWLKEPLGGRRLASSAVVVVGLLGLVAATL